MGFRHFFSLKETNYILALALGLALGVMGFVVLNLISWLAYSGKPPLMNELNVPALLLTLAGLLYYAHYTKRIAEHDYVLSAKFHLRPYLDPNLQDDPYKIEMVIENKCKRSLAVLCKTNLEIKKDPFPTNDFYDGSKVLPIQPHGIAYVQFHIKERLQQYEEANWEKLKEELNIPGVFTDTYIKAATRNDERDLFTMNIELSYAPLNNKTVKEPNSLIDVKTKELKHSEAVKNPPLPYYFNFKRNEIILDV